MAEQAQIPVYSRRLREARERRGLSQRDLGIEAGLDAFVASSRINRYERGVHQPKFELIARLARALGLPVAYFFAEDDELARLIVEFSRAGDRARPAP
ncbi:helix-turn-helix domain-containing protein [Luteimonas huabeiensis]|uniref:helix-turn-helix domain-containing protein n=1 Tax=Luteimonas huabeiensis TaxID=1244513 RepID=UPI00046338E2|nr:helix-turn-helix transcriptional regulator [Luteimonas huabeiensis]